jgi:hypothetical protein
MALPAARGPSRWRLALGVILCAILLPLAQAGLGALSVRMSSPWHWVVGTPLSYLVIAGLGAFSASGGLAPALARGRGSLLGVLAGGGGALIATLIMMAVFVLNYRSGAGSTPYPVARSAKALLALNAAMPGPPLPLDFLLVFFAPFFLANNLLGVGLAALGGMLGGWLRASLTWRGAPGNELAGGANVAAVAGVAALLAVVLAIAGIMFLTGAFNLFTIKPAP